MKKELPGMSAVIVEKVCGTMANDAYAHIAAVYDAVLTLLPGSVRRGVLEACLASSPRRLVDLGCGTGVFSRALAERVPVVVGLDASPAMLAKACARYGRCGDRAGLPDGHALVFLRGDGALPPFLPGSFDVALFSLVLHETDADAAILLGRACDLAPRVVVLEWRMPERNLEYVAAPLVHFVERCAGKEHYRNFRRYMRGGGLRGLAERAGARILGEQSCAAGAFVVASLTTGEQR